MLYQGSGSENFRTAGIVPFNPSRVLTSGKFGPSCVYRQANPTHTAPTGEEQKSCADAGVTNATVAPPTAAVSVREDLAVDQEMPCPQESTRESSNQPTMPSEPLRDEPSCSGVETVEPSCSILVTDEPNCLAVGMDEPSFSAPVSATNMMEVDEQRGEMEAVVAGGQLSSSSTTAAEVISEAVAEHHTLMNFQQLKAFKGMMDFVVKDVTVNEYESLFEALAGTRTEPHPKLDQFVGLFQAFKTSIKDEAGPSWQSGTTRTDGR